MKDFNCRTFIFYPSFILLILSEEDLKIFISLFFLLDGMDRITDLMNDLFSLFFLFLRQDVPGWLFQYTILGRAGGLFTDGLFCF